MSDPTLRVIIADDQPVIVRGFSLMLGAEADIDVIGTANNGLDAVTLTAELRPDVVLMDIRMPGMDGIEATRRITAEDAEVAVLMITTFDDEEYLRESARAGASGFLLKTAGADLLSTAVRSAARGDALIDPAMTSALLARTAARDPERRIDDDYTRRLGSLSEREREVLSLVADGLSNTEIGKQLFLGEATIKTHLGNVFTKLNARSRVGVVMFAYESGFLTPHWTDR